MNKKFISFIIVLSLFVSSLSISVSAMPTNTKQNNLESVACSSSASWNEQFNSEPEMRASSDIVIRGIVLSSEPELRYDMVFTRNYIKVTMVDKGEVEIDSVITVLQTGGTYLGYSTSALCEIPLLEPGKEYELYLRLSDYSEKYGQYYLISGGYQGVLEIGSDGSLVRLCDKNTIFLDKYVFSKGTTNSGLTYTPAEVYSWNKTSLVVYVQGNIRDRYNAKTRSGICSGIQAWEAQTDSPSTSITLSTASADVCVYMYDYGDTGWDAQTNTSYYVPSNICYYSRITVNAHYLSNYYAVEGLWKAIACHEFGHTLGLAHNNSTKPSIMKPSTTDYYDYIDGSPKYTVPQTADINPINLKY